MQTSNTFAKTKQQAIDFDGFGLQHDVANIQNYRAFYCKCNIKVVRQCSKESSYLAGASLADSNAAADEPEQVDDCVTSQI